MPPLTPAVVHVLLALAGGERHGYAILKDVQRQSSSQLRFGPGTIYGTLQRLMEAGWVEETRSRPKSIAWAHCSTSRAHTGFTRGD
jgi:DNA-binding PadR family transcriptional regulator